MITIDSGALVAIVGLIGIFGLVISLVLLAREDMRRERDEWE